MVLGHAPKNQVRSRDLEPPDLTAGRPSPTMGQA